MEFDGFLTEEHRELLRHYRLEHNLSQAAFAKQLTVSVTTYSHWENGTRTRCTRCLTPILSQFFATQNKKDLSPSSNLPHLFGEIARLYTQASPKQQKELLNLLDEFTHS